MPTGAIAGRDHATLVAEIGLRKLPTPFEPIRLNISNVTILKDADPIIKTSMAVRKVTARLLNHDVKKLLLKPNKEKPKTIGAIKNRTAETNLAIKIEIVVRNKGAISTIHVIKPKLLSSLPGLADTSLAITLAFVA